MGKIWTLKCCIVNLSHEPWEISTTKYVFGNTFLVAKPTFTFSNAVCRFVVLFGWMKSASRKLGFDLKTPVGLKLVFRASVFHIIDFATDKICFPALPLWLPFAVRILLFTQMISLISKVNNQNVPTHVNSRSVS